MLSPEEIVHKAWNLLPLRHPQVRKHGEVPLFRELYAVKGQKTEIPGLWRVDRVCRKVMSSHAEGRLLNVLLLTASLWLRCCPAGAMLSELSNLEAETLQEATRQAVPGVVRFRELIYGTDGYQYLVQE